MATSRAEQSCDERVYPIFRLVKYDLYHTGEFLFYMRKKSWLSTSYSTVQYCRPESLQSRGQGRLTSKVMVL